MKKILLLCGNFRGNLGDYAIMYATVLMINRLVDKCEISISYHGFTGVDIERTKAFIQTLPDNCTIIGPAPWYRPILLNRILRRIGLNKKQLSGFLFRYANFKYSRSREFISLFNGVDMAVISGGGHYVSPFLTANILSQINIATKKCAHTVCFPQSVTENLFDTMDISIIKHVLSKVDYLPLRDKVSYRIMKKLSPHNTHHISDVVFSLYGKITDIRKHGESLSKRVAFMLTGRGKWGGEKYAQELNLAMGAIRQAGYLPALITTTDSVDSVYLDDFGKIFPNVEMYRPDTWQELIVLLHDFDLVLTNRFHGIVFSILAKVPVVPVIDITKTEHMRQTIGLDIFLKNEQGLDSVFLEYALENRSEIIKLQEKYLEKAIQQLDKFSVDLKALLT